MTQVKEQDDKLPKPEGLKEYFRLAFTGFAMGAADIVPGVSGGTMAFILGVYEDLITSIKSFGLHSLKMALQFNFKKLLSEHPWQFLMALGVGLLTAVVTLSSILKTLLVEEPTYLFSFFAGLILASILSIGIRFEWHKVSVFALVLGTGIGFFIVGLNPQEALSHSLPSIFLSGMIAICAMILPGISGSFILLILGQYEYILEAVHNRELLTIAIFAIGCASGILIFVRILSYFLKRFHDPTIALLTGFMLGSMRVIWRKIEGGIVLVDSFGTSEMSIALGFTALGFVFVSVLDHLQTKNNPFCRLFSKTNGVTALAS